MFITFPVLGEGLPTINTRIFFSHDSMIPNCNVCPQTMNEMYVVEGCVYNENKIHIHFSHRHYDENRDYRSHYCYLMEKYYDSAK